MKFTTKGLGRTGLDLAVPFQVDVYLDGSGADKEGVAATLNFTSITRNFPNRRVSGIAEVDGGAVFAKVFYGRRARRYWQREIRGAELIGPSEAPSPKLVGQGVTADGAGYVVLYQALVDAAGLSDGSHVEMSAAARCLARLHDADLIQTDPHLNNFIYCKGMVYAVDFDGLKRTDVLCQHLKNLGVLLAQRAPEYDKEIEEIWRAYADERGESVQQMGSPEEIKSHTLHARRERVRRYIRKTQRECTEFVRRKRFAREFLCDRSHWSRMQRFMVAPDEFMRAGVPLKLGNSASVVRVRIEGKTYVVKRYNIKNFGHRLRRWFKRRGRNAWCNGHWLAFLGIETAKPVALLEKRWGWFPGVAYLVMPECGAEDLGHTLANHPDRFDELSRKTIALMCKLKDAGLRHGDLKATNFMVQGDAVLIIDYDAISEGRSATDAERFLANWEEETEIQANWRQMMADAGL